MEEITTEKRHEVEPTIPESVPTLDTPQTEGSGLKTIGYYKQIISQDLSPEIFKLCPQRLIYFGVCFVISLGSFWAIVNAEVSWPIKLLCGLIIGVCNGILAFIGHEISHGSVIKNQKLQDFLFFWGVLPFLISPTYWRFSHNKLHHGKTQKLIYDPDAFPNLRIFKASRFMKFMYPYTPGSGFKRSYLYFFFWFSFHNLVAQTYLRFRNTIFDTLDHKKVTREFGLQVIIAASLMIYAGPVNWIWAFLIPLFIQNYILMSHIATNHNLNPLTSENDPLVNSLSVSNHPLLEKMFLNFGYHVEHHIFPTVSGARIKPVHKALLKYFPDRYKIMPKGEAMLALYKTARVYKNSSELINPITSKTYPTI